MMSAMSVIVPRLFASLFVCLVVSSAASAQQPAEPAQPPRTWTGTAGAGLALTSGNSDTLNFNVAFDLTRDPKTRNLTKYKGLYIRGEDDGDTTVDRTALAFRDEYTLTPRTFVFGQIEYLRDTFKLIDYLVAPTAGIGFKVVNTDATKFTIDAGGGVVWEKNPGVDVRTSGAVSAGEKLEHKLSTTSTLKHATTALWKTDDFGDGLYTFSVGLATKVTETVQLSVDLLDTFKNKPPTADTKKNDVALVTSLAAKF
jgi:putative salt-induced outer membrane protein YdiY